MSAAAGSSALQTELAGLYDVDRTVINLDAAYYGAMTREVQAHYFERLMWVNRYNSTFLRSAVQGMPRDPELHKSRAAVAHLIGAAPDEVTLCGGGTEALYSLIVNYRPLKAGDAVMVEEPGWSVEFARLTALGMRVLPVPRRVDGPDLAVMARYCEEHAPKLFVSVSVFHNPTGCCLSPAAAHRVLQLAHRFGFHVVEDDTYSHIAPEHATRLTALDGLQRTIYVSGFAKILAPNWRIGFMAAPSDLVEPLLDTKLLSTLTTPALLEKALAICIEQGQLRRHAERIRTRLDAARARTVQRARGSGCPGGADPAGGLGGVQRIRG